MPAKDLGTKHVCFKCGTKFYDLGKAEPLCPKCGADQRQSPALKPAGSERRARPAARPPPPPVPADDAEADTELEDELDDDDEDEDEDDNEP